MPEAKKTIVPLTDAHVRDLKTPENGSFRIRDALETGFGIRVTAGDVRSFFLNYRTNTGRERLYTIGQWPGLKTKAAREMAADLKRRIRHDGFDPLAALEETRATWTIEQLWDHFKETRLPKRRPGTRKEYEAMARQHVLPAFRHRTILELTSDEVQLWHDKISVRTPYRANRVLALLSSMYGLVAKLRPVAPTKGVAKNKERARRRYLDDGELRRLIVALDAHEDREAADVVRLLLLTGARKGEVLGAKWAMFDLAKGLWIKPASITKTDEEHHLPLSAPALDLLREMRRKSNHEYLFPARDDDQKKPHRHDLKRAWPVIAIAAGLYDSTFEVNPRTGEQREIKTPNFRIHDLRHSHASFLINQGVPLPIIGGLLNHARAETTARYAHLTESTLRKASEVAGSIISAAMMSRPPEPPPAPPNDPNVIDLAARRKAKS